MLLTCVRAVRSLTTSASAIWRLERPWATSTSTSRSRAVSDPTAFDHLQVGPQAAADHGVVVDDEHPDWPLARVVGMSQGVRDSFWLWSMQVGLKGAYDCIKAFSETDLTEGAGAGRDLPAEAGGHLLVAAGMVGAVVAPGSSSTNVLLMYP
jgi:hypothetical protein